MHARVFTSIIALLSACTAVALARPMASPQPQDGGIVPKWSLQVPNAVQLGGSVISKSHFTACALCEHKLVTLHRELERSSDEVDGIVVGRYAGDFSAKEEPAPPGDRPQPEMSAKHGEDLGSTLHARGTRYLPRSLPTPEAVELGDLARVVVAWGYAFWAANFECEEQEEEVKGFDALEDAVNKVSYSERTFEVVRFETAERGWTHP
ncbi:hypothetical protein BKA70DRAFT_1240421 [Coprinopsis sp. MPI-PUGE-AT-0042]|nr:hypothetical protein BKA70DRAFT_1240421 [Coprinopsis sp. MPI-PUGE-AT-0042]